MKLVNRVKEMNPRAIVVGLGSLSIVMFALILVIVSSSREDIVVLNAMELSTGGGGAATVTDDLYTQPAGEPVDAVDYSQTAQEIDHAYDQAAKEPAQTDPIGGVADGTDTQAGGGVPDVYVPDPTVADPMVGGGGSVWIEPVAQVDISTPADVGGGTDGVYVPTTLVATCGGNGLPCKQTSVTYHNTPPPVSYTYTVTNPDTGVQTTHTAAGTQ